MEDYKKVLTEQSVVQVPVLEDAVSIFDLLKGCTFRIPLYQRAFAWGTPPHEVNENELICLIDDIHDANDADEYFIGTIVVKVDESNDHSVCEVIDGQQRLTALFILLSCLGVEIKAQPPLDYQQRVRSVNAVKRIKDIVSFAKAFVTKDATAASAIIRMPEGDWFYGDGKEPLENSICNGVLAVLRHLRSKESKDRGYEELLRSGLEKVRLYVVRVPGNTDLNRYFEVMNTRGEQLEPQDIVKAMLMRQLKDIKKCKLFAQIWNACSDMNGYVQTHLPSKARKDIFGADWTGLPNFDDVASDEVADNPRMSICESLLQGDMDRKSDEEQTNDGELEKAEDPSRFRSVIYFPHFLLNVLKVFNHSSNWQAKLDDSELDVSKMIRKFEGLFKQGGEELPDDRKEVIAWEFVKCLLVCRFLFDKYIIKRDYERDTTNGDWSLRELKKSGDNTAYYVPTDWQENEAADTGNVREEILMLQSCLRVTYTDFKGMHWITKLLDWLCREYAVERRIGFTGLVKEAEMIACSSAKEGVVKLQQNNYRMGTATPHIIFNYLDFLLWRDGKREKKFISQGGTWKPFVFAYRNSVEHWYPQHPENLEEWSETDGENRRAVDQFGNLCVVQPSENSKFSNLRPKAKKDQYMEDVISKGSLKLRLMAEQTIDANEVQWKTACATHGQEMLDLLSAAFTRVLGPIPQNGQE